MKHKKLLGVFCAACLCAYPGVSASAASVSGSDAQGIGPGFETAAEENTQEEPAASVPWTRVNGAYVDSSGNVIEGAILRGISVSKWQGSIDWARVAADDVSFALIRMGSFGYEGEYTMDETFDQNMRGARASGIHTSPYVFLQTRTVEEAREAAAFAVETARQYDVTYPLAVDIESQYILDLSVQELTDVVNAFCEVVAAAGYTPIVYSDYSKFTTEMDTSQIPYDIWLARYGGDNSYPNRTMWQATDQGQIDGISGNVCLEFAFKNYASGTGVTNPAYTGEWRQESGKWYYYQDGGRISGWIQPDGNWYYMDPGDMGAMVAGTTMTIDGTAYSFDANGVMR